MSTSFFPSSKSLLINILTICLLCSACLSKIHVDISDHLPNRAPPITVHCQSKDNDLGSHTLYPNQPSYTWAFGARWIVGDTLFFCHFYWDGKEAVFDVYNQKWGVDYCARFAGSGRTKTMISNTCYWQVKSEGIYLSRTSDPVNFDGPWLQFHKWGDK